MTAGKVSCTFLITRTKKSRWVAHVTHAATSADPDMALEKTIQAEAGADSRSVLSQREVRSVITGLMMAILLGAIDQTIVAVALPMMSSELKGFELLAWVVSGYMVAVAVTTPIYGKLGDLFGRRATLTFAIAIFLIASVACALAQSMPMLVAARILQGVGGGGLISVAQAIIADVVAPRERGRYQGYISGAFATAGICGPLLGGLLTEYLSWRWVFWINLPLGLATILITRRALARLPVPRMKRQIDYLGAALLTTGLSTLLVGVTRVGQGSPWLDADNLTLFAIGMVFMAAFLWQERRAIEPIIPLWLFRMPTVTISCILLFIAYFQSIALTVLIPLRLQMVTGSGLEAASYQLVPLAIAVSTGSFTSGRLVAHIGRYKPFQLAGTAIVTVAVFALALIDPRATVLSMLCMALGGIGIGFMFPSSMVAVQNAVPATHIGIATACTSFFRSLGAAIGIAILSAVLLAALREHAPAMVASMSGGENMREMLGGALASMDETARMELMAAVQGTFQTTFIISGMVALAGFLLATLISDQVLGDRPAR
jgi:EmrB/QacA subfamily drug resistance transporter